MRKISFMAFLVASSLLVVSCGDKEDKRLSNQDVACLKLLQQGQSCAPGGIGTGATTTITATATTTVTNTTTVK